MHNQEKDSLISYTPEPFTILGEDDVVADFKAQPTMTYPYEEIQFTDLSLGLITTWEWDFDNDGTVDATDRNPSWSYSQLGTYTVKLTVSDGTATGSETKTDYITILPHVALEETTNGLTWSLSPNPCRGTLTLRCVIPAQFLQHSRGNSEDGHVNLSLYDVKGNVVKELHAGKAHPGMILQTWDIHELSPGLYSVTLQICSWMQTNKIIVSP